MSTCICGNYLSLKNNHPQKRIVPRNLIALGTVSILNGYSGKLHNSLDINYKSKRDLASGVGRNYPQAKRGSGTTY